jgi:PPOX class probable F420-dependent enzyme
MVGAYGLARGRRGLLPWDWARRRLIRAHNYWVSTTGPGGRPHAMPVWGLWLDESFCFSTARRSRKARNLARDPRLVVHLESGDQTVILEGRARPITDAAVLQRYAAAYEPKYRHRPDPADATQRTYAVRVEKAFAWRERDFLTSATRWRFRRAKLAPV